MRARNDKVQPQFAFGGAFSNLQVNRDIERGEVVAYDISFPRYLMECNEY